MNQTCIRYLGYIVFSSILLGYSITYAQTDTELAQSNLSKHQPFMSLCIFGGMSIPIGNFAGIDNAEYGFAKNGYAISIGYNIPINNPLYWCSFLSYSSNPLNEESIVRRYTGNLSNLSKTIGSYSFLFPATGIGIQRKVVHGISVFGEAQIGWLFIFEPEISIIQQGYTIINQTQSKINAFAYCLSLGVQLLDNFKLNARYLVSKPNYKGYYNLANGCSDISIVQVSVGVGF